MFHAGHELVIERKLRLVDDGATLLYADSVTGPGRTVEPREVAFDVRPK
jgi:hypothetical protein